MRAKAFAGQKVDEALMLRANRNANFLRGLLAHRGEEVSEVALEEPQSRVWAEAENRLHPKMAIMTELMGGEKLAVA